MRRYREAKPIGFGIGYVWYLGAVLATTLKWQITDALGRRLILMYLCLAIEDWVICLSIISLILCWTFDLFFYQVLHTDWFVPGDTYTVWYCRFCDDERNWNLSPVIRRYRCQPRWSGSRICLECHNPVYRCLSSY